jgi:hypothetical protein
MKTVTITVSPSGAVFKLNIDGKPISASGGTASKNLPGGREHALQWWIKGPNGTKYTVAITAPPEAATKYTATFNKDGEDANQLWFWLDLEKS